ncbi:MAG: fibronectin type III domain-containing protein, partial [Vicinamibacterales bacterium]
MTTSQLVARLAAVALLLGGIGTTLTAGGLESIQLAPEPPTNLRVIAQAGHSVTLAWSPPETGPEPAGYVLEGGLAPGQVLAAIPVAGGAQTLTGEVPSGSFFVRLHALADGERSGPSNEIQLFVDAPVPPSAPANLLGTVNESTVSLSWTNTYTGGQPTRMWLEVSGSSAALLEVPVGTAFTYPNVPDGTYTVRLIA